MRLNCTRNNVAQFIQSRCMKRLRSVKIHIYFARVHNPHLSPIKSPFFTGKSKCKLKTGLLIIACTLCTTELGTQRSEKKKTGRVSDLCASLQMTSKDDQYVTSSLLTPLTNHAVPLPSHFPHDGCNEGFAEFKFSAYALCRASLGTPCKWFKAWHPFNALIFHSLT